MDINVDYKELFKTLNKYRVKYLVVGAYAVIYYAEPRFTKDLDIWVDSEPKNARKLYKALKEFKAPLRDMQPEDFTNKHIIYQIGVAPVRVDIIMGLPGINFAKAWENKVLSKYGNVVINILGLKELIKSKQKTKRMQDKLDLQNLKAVLERKL